MSTGRSPDQESVGSGTKRSSVSSGGRPRNQKEFFYKFVESDSLTAKLVDWFESVTEKSELKQQAFDVPFELIELQKFDYALEGISFQQHMFPFALFAGGFKRRTLARKILIGSALLKQTHD